MEKLTLETLSKEQLIQIIKMQQKEKEELVAGVEKFIQKNYEGSSKSDRSDYGSVVESKDIWDLKEIFEKIKIEPKKHL